MHIRFIFIFNIFLIVLLGCTVPNNTIAPTTTITTIKSYNFKIEKIYWVVINANTNFQNTEYSCYYMLSFTYSGDITYDDITFIRIYNPSNSTRFIINPVATMINTNTKYIGIFQMFDENNLNNVELGEYQIEVYLKNNSIIKASVYFTLPGGVIPSNDKKIIAYTEDYKDATNDSFVPCLKRSQVMDYTKTDSINIKFKINDKNTYNGCIKVYDSQNNLIGHSKYFRNENQTLNSFINNANFFNNDVTNDLILTQNDFIFFSSYNFNDIKGFNIEIYDGEQYKNDFRINYDYVSCTRRYNF